MEEIYSCSHASIYREERGRGGGGGGSEDQKGGSDIIIGVTSRENPIFAVWQR